MRFIDQNANGAPAGGTETTFANLWWTAGIAAVVALLALVASQWNGVPAAIGIGILITISAAATGSGFGFLFAVPRVLTKETTENPASTPISSETQKRLLASNTNLERVSDWLTTIFVGVGLTQLSQINESLVAFRDFLKATALVFPSQDQCHVGSSAVGVCSAGTLPSIGPMLLIFGFVTGFISFYLFTRLKLSSLFHFVEDLLLSGPRGEAVKRVAEQVAKESGSSGNPNLQAVLLSTEPSIDSTLNLMLTLLYRDGQYRNVIALGAQLINTPAKRRADFWFYLAAAFGQQFHDLKIAAKTEEANSAKDNMFDCARRAVQIDKSYRSRLWDISDPAGPDDDLADFRSLPEFLKLVGRAGSTPQ